MELKLNVKPLSANKMFYRNKNKTAEYRSFQEEVRDEMMGVEWQHEDKPVKFIIKVGLSSKLADLDNTLKPLLDTFQSIYPDFNDKMVYRLEAEKELVEKGKEYLHVQVLQDELP